jgi:hypothetical protein
MLVDEVNAMIAQKDTHIATLNKELDILQKQV